MDDAFRGTTLDLQFQAEGSNTFGSLAATEGVAPNWFELIRDDENWSDTKVWEDWMWEVSTWRYKLSNHSTELTAYRLLHRLQGQYIPRLFGVDSVFEYIPGVSMTKLKPGVDVSMREAERTSSRVMEALHALEAENCVLHNAIHVGNVVLRDGSRSPVSIDFGRADVREPELSDVVTFVKHPFLSLLPFLVHAKLVSIHYEYQHLMMFIKRHQSRRDYVLRRHHPDWSEIKRFELLLVQRHSGDETTVLKLAESGHQLHAGSEKKTKLQCQSHVKSDISNTLHTAIFGGIIRWFECSITPFPLSIKTFKMILASFLTASSSSLPSLINVNLIRQRCNRPAPLPAVYVGFSRTEGPNFAPRRRARAFVEESGTSSLFSTATRYGLYGNGEETHERKGMQGRGKEDDHGRSGNGQRIVVLQARSARCRPEERSKEMETIEETATRMAQDHVPTVFFEQEKAAPGKQ
ncbi:hypothetical protein EDD85DRAFT_794751 [Armillaria nabsnona]|nr:hypothetical protein EDD85DRAFT_794751 [Armillaria nabsnona]